MRNRFLILLFFSAGVATGSEGFLFFESKVRPILEDHCLKCHSEAKKVKGGLLLDRKKGWEEGGDSGPVIVLGKPDESLLIQMVKHDPDVEAMPPKSKLSAAEVEVLVKWVEMRAPDPRVEEIGAAVKKSGFDLEERKKWWSLQPLARVKVPVVKNESWPKTEIDRFVLSKLETKGWSPAEEADRVTLFRRVSVVLTGLAPTPDELVAFLEDDKEGAYERAVDRLMNSPHFGEQWARHWMDVVRYGESKAFEQDYYMPYSWRYRDYLTRAFNEDVPFDQFVREALAGDLLEEPRLNPENGFNESVAGPGFLHLADGHHGVTDLHEDEARIMDSMINAVGTAFHGLTIACARCHDHKFDAITDEDYYSLYGMFRSSRLHYANVAESKWTKEKEGKLRSSHESVVKEAMKNALTQQEGLAVVLEEVKRLSGDAALVKAWRKLNPRNAKAKSKLKAQLAKRTTPHAAQWFEALNTPGGRPELAGLRRLFDEKSPLARATEVLPEQKWLIDGVGVEEAGNGRFLVNANDSRVIAGSVGAGMVMGHLSARLDGAVRSEDFVTDGGPVKIWVKGRGATVSLVIRNYELAGHGPTTAPLRKSVNSDDWRLYQFPTNLWKGQVAFLQVQHQGESKRVRKPKAGSNFVRDDAWAAVATSLPDWNKVWESGGSIAAVFNSLLSGPKNEAEVEVLGALFSAGLVELDQNDAELKLALKGLSSLRDSIEKPVYVRSLVDGTSQHERVYIRGNHKRPSEEKNPRRFLAGLNGDVISGRGSGRREWAEELLKVDNPLTARVRVNRVWSRVFGRGIVASVDDFGKMGEQPTHPKLLDYLANDFMKEKWSTKVMIRKMVLSSAFRMSSVPSVESAKEDPTNALRQHMPVRRMPAESIRDHILASSGELKRDLFGPSVLAYIDDQPPSRAKPNSGPLNGDGRRSIYVASRRNYLSSFLRAFDAPNASEPIGKRNVTTVPAQSLALMNHPMVHQQAEIWGEKVLKSSGSIEEKLQRIHQVAFTRTATEEEMTWSAAALEKLGIKTNAQDAWSSFCHIIINRKEFIYVF